MSVRKRSWTTSKGERREAWIVDYTDQNGERHIQTFERKRDADQYKDQVGVDVRKGVHTPVNKSITVSQAAAAWIKTAELNEREASTIAQYRQHKRHIEALLKDVTLAELTTPRVSKFKDDLLGEMSRALARKVLTSLKSLLSDARGRGNVGQNVALPIKFEADKRKRKLQVGRDIPSTDEVRHLLAKVSGRLRPLVVLAAFAGLRASELRGLRWRDIDLKRGVVHVR